MENMLPCRVEHILHGWVRIERGLAWVSLEVILWTTAAVFCSSYCRKVGDIPLSNVSSVSAIKKCDRHIGWMYKSLSKDVKISWSMNRHCWRALKAAKNSSKWISVFWSLLSSSLFNVLLIWRGMDGRQVFTWWASWSFSFTNNSILLCWVLFSSSSLLCWVWF